MQDRDKKLAELNKYLDNRVSGDVELKEMNTFQIGGKAAMFFLAKNTDDVVRAVTFAKKLKIAFVVISGCSNILINDTGIDKLVILIKSNEIILDKNYIIADAGAKLSEVVNFSIENGLQGLVWASGIPGSIGGAVRGNAGAYGGEMKDNVHSVEILRGSKQFILNNEQLGYGYRDSIFKHNSDTILIVKLELKKGGRVNEMKKESQDIILERQKKHPDNPSAGSFFKNIPITYENEEIFKKLELPEKYFTYSKAPAGWLLDQLDMKGFEIGGAKISDLHSNMIINKGDATAEQIIQIASIMKMKVRDEFGIKLEEEVELLGF